MCKSLSLKVRDQIDLNEITREVLEPLGGELKDRRITILSELTTRAPLVDGNKRQLQEVIRHRNA
jgi:hypothetical protein